MYTVRQITVVGDRRHVRDHRFETRKEVNQQIELWGERVQYIQRLRDEHLYCVTTTGEQVKK